MDIFGIFKEIESEVYPLLKNYRKNLNNIEVSIKQDNTFLTEADIAIQNKIISIIRKYDIHSSIIAEEKDCCVINPNCKTAWIIDPIDGTSQFIDKNSYEYCSCICYISKGIPVASMIIMPELGINKSKLTAIGLLDSKTIYVNDNKVKYSFNIKNKNASTTRSKGTIPSEIETSLVKLGYVIKNRTTSQSIDMLRTAIDISTVTENKLQSFEIFYRKNQKIWDGAPGMCFNLIVGKNIVSSNNAEILPLDKLLFRKTFVTESILVCKDDFFQEIK